MTLHGGKSKGMYVHSTEDDASGMIIGYATYIRGEDKYYFEFRDEKERVCRVWRTEDCFREEVGHV